MSSGHKISGHTWRCSERRGWAGHNVPTNMGKYRADDAARLYRQVAREYLTLELSGPLERIVRGALKSFESATLVRC